MLQTLIGKENFIAGIRRYAKDFDGKAATTEDFVSSTIKGACENGYKINFNANQFQDWYYESGTPHVSIRRELDRNGRKLKLIISQRNKLSNKPLVIPINILFNGINSIFKAILYMFNFFSKRSFESNVVYK